MKAVQRKILRAGIVIAIALLLSSFGLGWVIVSRGFSARDEPSFVEAFVARRVRRLGTPRGARELKNPVPESPKALSEAMAHFADHCAICHGNNGDGRTLIGRGLYPKPPDMRKADTQDLSDGELYYIIENGIRLTAMPAFGESDQVDDNETWTLVRFIRHLPSMTDDEVAQMKEMNPKTRDELKKEEELRRFLSGEADAPSVREDHNHRH